MKNHPTKEDLVRYLSEEILPGEQAEIRAHIEQCSNCRNTVHEWHTTLEQLDAWALPKQRRKSLAAKWVPLAAAACVLIGVGFGVGRFSVNPGMPKEEVAALVENEKANIYKDFVLALETARLEDRQLTSLMMDELRADQSYKLVQLRKDLETVAAGADAGLRETQMGLIQLSAYKQQ